MQFCLDQCGFGVCAVLRDIAGGDGNTGMVIMSGMRLRNGRRERKGHQNGRRSQDARKLKLQAHFSNLAQGIRFGEMYCRIG